TCLFFFQAEDGIRDRNVTGVQTCALPILKSRESIKFRLRRRLIRLELLSLTRLPQLLLALYQQIYAICTMLTVDCFALAFLVHASLLTIRAYIWIRFFLVMRQLMDVTLKFSFQHFLISFFYTFSATMFSYNNCINSFACMMHFIVFNDIIV